MTPAQTLPRKTSPKRRLTNWIRTQPILAALTVALVLVALLGGGAAVARLVCGGENPARPPPGRRSTATAAARRDLLARHPLDALGYQRYPELGRREKSHHHSSDPEAGEGRPPGIDPHLALRDRPCHESAETDAYQQSKVQAALNTGARLLCELPTGNSMTYDEQMVKLFAGKCSYYEFMNEPDNEQIPVATYFSKVGERDPQAARHRPACALRWASRHHAAI